MVQYLTKLDRKFSALSDPTRRSILDRLGHGDASISELAAPTGMTLTGIKKHVQILEKAELVSTEKRGRTRFCQLDPKGFDEAEFWLEEFRRNWTDRHDRLEKIIERKKKEQESE